MNILRSLTVLLLLTSAAAIAQEIPEESVLHLVPIVAEKAPGGFGSIWSTELLAFNASQTRTVISGPCQTSLCVNEVVPAGSTANVTLFRRDGRESFIYTYPKVLTLQARVFDESRQALNWGTHLPVVEWDAEKGNEFWFVRVPTAEPFRHSVRAFRHFEAGPVPIRVRYYDVETNELLAERSDDAYGSSAWHSFNVAEIAGRETVRIEVTSDSPIWAMVSVTNEETQFVTILPGRAVQPQP
jgi:hypothetical protein